MQRKSWATAECPRPAPSMTLATGVALTFLRRLAPGTSAILSAKDFPAALTEAVAETGTTLAFDAIGGGRLVSRILAAMETGRRPTDERLQRIWLLPPQTGLHLRRVG